MAFKLYVGGLSYSTNSDSLRQYFAQCGTVESSTVITDRDTGESRGFGFVEMATQAEGESAIAKLNEQVFEGRKLTVSVAKGPGARGGASRLALVGGRTRSASTTSARVPTSAGPEARRSAGEPARTEQKEVEGSRRPTGPGSAASPA